MATTRKYLKFGLRADKNLSDMSDQSEGLGNLLNNLDRDVRDVHGDLVGFRVDDVVSLQQLSQTDISSTAPTPGAIPEAWTWLRENIAFQAVNGRNVNIQPLVTIQDEINKGKIVLGDPPFVSGGTGPITTYIPSARFAPYIPNSGLENEKVAANKIRKGNRYRIESLGSPAISDGLWNNVSTTTNTGYTAGDIFTASTSSTHEFSLDDMSDGTDGSIQLEVGNGLLAGMQVRYLETDSTYSPSNLSHNTVYFIHSVNAGGQQGSIKLALQVDGSPIAFTKPTIEDIDDPNRTVRSADNFKLVLEGYDNGEIRNVTMPSGKFATEAEGLDPDELNSTLLYTKKVDPTGAIGPDLQNDDEFWSETGFSLSTPFYPVFPDNFGGVQFEGYLEDGFNPTFETNGFLVVEQDLQEDGTDNNWELIKGVNTDRLRPIYPVSWGVDPNDSSKTRLTFNSNGEDIKRLATGMLVTIKPDEHATAQAAYEADPTNQALLDAVTDVGKVSRTISSIDVENNFITVQKMSYVDSSGNTQNATASSSFDLTIDWNMGGSDRVSFPTTISKPVGRRRRVRITCWWPQRNLGNRDLGQTDKVFSDISSNRTNLKIGNFYKDQNNQDFSNKKYSFPFYRDRRASATQQESQNQLKVEYTARNIYEPVRYAKDTTDYYDATTYGAEGRMGVIPLELGPNGLMKYSTIGGDQLNLPFEVKPPHNNIEFIGNVGDIVITHNESTGTYHAFKITFIDTDEGAFLVDPSYSTVTGITEGTVHRVLLVKNKGLHGIYSTTHDGSNHTLTQLSTSDASYSYHVNQVRKEDFIYKVEYDNISSLNQHLSAGRNRTYAPMNQIAFKLETIDHEDTRNPSTTSANFTVSAHPQASGGVFTSSQSLSTNNGIILAYSSKGLNDRSAITECTDVFGHEVSATASVGSNVLTLKSVEGISGGDIVYLDGTIPYSETDPTIVGVVNSGAKTITLVNQNGNVTITKEAPPGTTVVFVPATAGPANDGWGKENKEYCVTPLNTAPPWAGTTEGLETTDSNPSIVAKELRFTDLTFLDVPTNQISDLSGTTLANGYFDITYND